MELKKLEEIAWNFTAYRVHDKTILMCSSFKQLKINVVVSNRRYNRLFGLSAYMK